MNLNSATVIGRLTREIDLRAVGSTQVANFTIATNKRWVGKDGEQKEAVSYVDCKAWGKTCDHLAHAVKGDHVMVVGSLTSESWEAKDGTKRSKLLVTAEQVIHLMRQPEPPPHVPGEPAPRNQPKAVPTPEVSQEDIPF